MPTEVKCPSCGYGFPIEEVMAEEYKQKLRSDMQAFKQQKETEFKHKEDEFVARQQLQQQQFDQRLLDEKKQLQLSIEENTRRKLTADYEARMQMLNNNVKDAEEKLKLSRRKELEFLQRETALKQKEEEMQLEMERRLLAQRNDITEQVRKQEADRNAMKDNAHQLRVKELEMQLEQQKKLADEMKRKAEQGSMQLQGEAQELVLEELLRTHFPFDMIGEVGKGVRGADCIQTVRNQFGQECGTIIYESKRTNAFGGDWVEKLKKDMRSTSADIAVIVTQCYPKDMDCFGEKDGVWICSFDEVKALAYVLRDFVIKMSAVVRAQDNKGDKMHLLYDFLTSNEFSEQWKAIREGFMNMRMSIIQERTAMEKLWKSREKQLDKVLLSASSIKGSIEGIAGNDSIQLSLTDDEDMLMLD